MNRSNRLYTRTAVGLSVLGLVAATVAPTAGAASRTTKKKAAQTKKVATTLAPASTAAPTTAGPTTTARVTTPVATTAPVAAEASTPAIPLDPNIKTDQNGSIRLSFVVPPRVLDPHKEDNIGQRPYWVLIYDTLFDLSQASQPRPQVATLAAGN